MGTSEILPIGDMDMARLAAHVYATAPRRAMSRAAYLRLARDLQARIKDGPYLSFSRYSGTARRSADCLEATALVADFDTCPDPWGSIRRLGEQGLAYTAWATTSDDPAGARKARLVLPLARPVSPSDYRAAYPSALEALGLAGADPAGSCASQAWWLPVVFRGEDGPVVQWQDGAPLQLQVPAVTPPVRKCSEHRSRDGVGYQQDLAGLEAALLDAGWRLVRRSGQVAQWTRPGKASGVSGTTRLSRAGDAIFHCFSSNASPFEPGRTYDRVGVKAALEGVPRLDAWLATVRPAAPVLPFAIRQRLNARHGQGGRR